MNTTVEQLRAAKALIDTPDKLAVFGLIPVLLAKCNGAAVDAFAATLRGSYDCLSLVASMGDFETLCILFDRAIADAEQSEVQS